MKHTFIYDPRIEPTIESIDIEDSGCAKILHISDGTQSDDGLFIRLQSWKDDKNHEAFDSLVNGALEGKKIKVTVELVP